MLFNTEGAQVVPIADLLIIFDFSSLLVSVNLSVSFPPVLIH